MRTVPRSPTTARQLDLAKSAAGRDEGYGTFEDAMMDEYGYVYGSSSGDAG